MVLHWQWPDGRMAQHKWLVMVEKVEPAPKGALGLDASPSMAHALPDAMDASLRLISGDPSLIGQTLRLRLPGPEAKKIAQTPVAALGLVKGRVCICVAPVPVQNPVTDSVDTKAAEAWLQRWSCP